MITEKRGNIKITYIIFQKILTFKKYIIIYIQKYIYRMLLFYVQVRIYRKFALIIFC